MHDPFADLVGLKPAARPSVPIRNVGSASGLSSASAGTLLSVAAVHGTVRPSQSCRCWPSMSENHVRLARTR